MRQTDPWEVAGIAIELLKIARIHQLVTPEGSRRTRQPRRHATRPTSRQSPRRVDAVRIVTPTLQDMDSYEQTRQASQSVSAEKGKKGEADQAGDPATDQLVRVSEAPTVYLPTGQGGKLIVERFPVRVPIDGDGRAHHARTGCPPMGCGAAAGLRRALPAVPCQPAPRPANRVRRRRPLPIHRASAWRRLYERMFERRDLPTRRSYGVSLLVDGSASMLQPRPTRAAASRRGLWPRPPSAPGRLPGCATSFRSSSRSRCSTAASSPRTMTRGQLQPRRADATGALRRSQGGNAERLTRTVNHYLLKSFDDRWRQAEDRSPDSSTWRPSPRRPPARSDSIRTGGPPLSMFEKAANVDEYNLAYAAKRLASRHVTHRIVVVLADGMTRGSVNDLAECVHEVELGGATVLGIGIGDDTVRAAYSRHQIVETPETLAAAMVDGVRSGLLKTWPARQAMDGGSKPAVRRPGRPNNFAQTMRSINA